MQKYLLPWRAPAVLLHGGVESVEPAPAVVARHGEFLRLVAATLREMLLSGVPAFEAAQEGIVRLESSGLFNAGAGSGRQCDGAVRVTASCMESTRGLFSAVALVTHVVNPSRLAVTLQDRADRVLGPLGAQLLARELGLPMELPFAEESAQRWIESRRKAAPARAGTVGVVTIDSSHRLAAMTSTGGSSPENLPERMSDVATVAGNYCSSHAAVSCSGVGEQIVDLAVAARLETRLRDGMPLDTALDRLLAEAGDRRARLGAIVATPLGCAVAFTTPYFAIAGTSAEGAWLQLPQPPIADTGG